MLRKSVIFAGLLAVTLHYFYNLLGFPIVLEYNDQSCNLIGADVLRGSEDMTVFSANLIFVSSGDLHHLFAGYNTSAGFIGMVDLRGDKPTVHKLVASDMPSNLKFQPHGIFFSNTTQRLYAVSHGLEAGGGTRIFLFNVIRPTSNSASALPQLKFVTTLTSKEHFFSGALNDLVEGFLGETEIYTTVWMQRPLPAKGKKHPSNLAERFDVIAQGLLTIFYPGTYVLRCELPKGLGASTGIATEITCSIVSKGYYGANGITTNAARDTLFVADPPSKQLRLLRRDKQTGLIKEDGALVVPYMLDNIEMDTGSDSKIFGGTMPVPWKVLRKLEGAEIDCPGGLQVLERNEKGKMVTSDLIMHDGSKLSELSSGVHHGSHVLIGSPFGQGLLHCRA